MSGITSINPYQHLRHKRIRVEGQDHSSAAAAAGGEWQSSAASSSAAAFGGSQHEAADMGERGYPLHYNPEAMLPQLMELLQNLTGPIIEDAMQSQLQLTDKISAGEYHLKVLKEFKSSSSVPLYCRRSSMTFPDEPAFAELKQRFEAHSKAYEQENLAIAHEVTEVKIALAKEQLKGIPDIAWRKMNHLLQVDAKDILDQCLQTLSIPVEVLKKTVADHLEAQISKLTLKSLSRQVDFIVRHNEKLAAAQLKKDRQEAARAAKDALPIDEIVKAAVKNALKSARGRGGKKSTRGRGRGSASGTGSGAAGRGGAGTNNNRGGGRGARRGARGAGASNHGGGRGSGRGSTSTRSRGGTRGNSRGGSRSNLRGNGRRGRNTGSAPASTRTGGN